MFDNVGRDPDQEANKRRAASFALTLSLLAGGLAFVVTITAWTAVQVVPELMQDEDMVEVVMEDAEIEDEAPPPPPPPPPPPAAAEEEEEEEEEDVEETPDEMDETVEELKEEVKDEIKNANKPAGVEGGVEGGVAGGVVGGVIGGVEGGVIGGQLGGVRVMHHSELEWKKRVQWDYPKAAQELNLGDQRCIAKVFLDEEGVPYDVKVEDCPKVFHSTTIEALMKWRAYPSKDGKERVKVQTTIGVNYKFQ